MQTFEGGLFMKPVEDYSDLLSTSATTSAHAATSHFPDTIFPTDLIGQGLQLNRFQITIRLTDWFSWAFGTPLQLDDHWVQAIFDIPALGKVKEFRLELDRGRLKRTTGCHRQTSLVPERQTNAPQPCVLAH